MERLKPVLLTWKALLANPRPSCRQTTMASTMPQFSPHTIPQTRDPFLSTSTSTRPSKGFRPPFRRSCREKGRHGHQEDGEQCHQSQFSHATGPAWDTQIPQHPPEPCSYILGPAAGILGPSPG